ncbi:carbohydrate-binding module family 48 protein, partial [Serendipita vermifera MAFF 305830]
MTVLHQAPFKWPVGPSKVVVTGTFDNWSCSTQLTKTDAGFTGTFDLPWDHKFQYKYVVDDVWKVNPAEPTERDPAGNINNVYTTPSAPPATSSVEEAKGNATSIVSYVASGLGAAFATVTGIDPINPQQIRLEDDKAKEVPVPDAQKAGPAPTAGAAQDPLVPEAPIDAKKPSDALAP